MQALVIAHAATSYWKSPGRSRHAANVSSPTFHRKSRPTPPCTPVSDGMTTPPTDTTSRIDGRSCWKNGRGDWAGIATAGGSTVRRNASIPTVSTSPYGRNAFAPATDGPCSHTTPACASTTISSAPTTRPARLASSARRPIPKRPKSQSPAFCIICCRLTAIGAPIGTGPTGAIAS